VKDFISFTPLSLKKELLNNIKIKRWKVKNSKLNG
jgi:hypothetical protein